MAKKFPTSLNPLKTTHKTDSKCKTKLRASITTLYTEHFHHRELYIWSVNFRFVFFIAKFKSIDILPHALVEKTFICMNSVHCVCVCMYVFLMLFREEEKFLRIFSHHIGGTGAP